jgi:hypothetical protein
MVSSYYIVVIRAGDYASPLVLAKPIAAAYDVT